MLRAVSSNPLTNSEQWKCRKVLAIYSFLTTIQGFWSNGIDQVKVGCVFLKIIVRGGGMGQQYGKVILQVCIILEKNI